MEPSLTVRLIAVDDIRSGDLLHLGRYPFGHLVRSVAVGWPPPNDPGPPCIWVADHLGGTWYADPTLRVVCLRRWNE